MSQIDDFLDNTDASSSVAPTAIAKKSEIDEFLGDAPEHGIGTRFARGFGRAVDSAKTALTDDPKKIAKIAAEQARTALPQTALQRKMAEEFQPYVDAANKSEGFVDGVATWGAAGFKRAGQLLSNPAEAGKMMAEQIPNSLPSLAGMYAGGKAGAALGSMVAPGPGTVVGGVLGGIAGSFAGSYGLEKGAAVQEQVQKEAQKRGIDIQDQAAVAGMVGENYGEIEATAQRKGVGTAGTDAILNVATMGLAGIGGRAITKEAQALHAAVKSGAMDAAEASTRLAALESANAARNTLGAKALRGTGVVGGEMVGEGLSEAVGQKYAYGEVDAGQVIDESLLGFGTGTAMALGSKAFNKAAGIADQDATTQRIEAARADIERQLQGIPEHQRPAARAQLNAELNAQLQAEARAAGLLDEEQGPPDVPPGNPNDYRATPAWAKPPEDAATDYGNADDEILQSTGFAQQRPDPVRQAVQQAADAGGALSAAAGLAMDTGAAPSYTPGYMPPAMGQGVEQATEEDAATADAMVQQQGVTLDDAYQRAPEGPVRIGAGYEHLSEGGKPFASREEAAAAKQMQPMFRIIPVQGGYALTEKTPAQLAAEQKNARRLSSPQTSPSGEPIPAHAFIASEGGLARMVAPEIGVDRNPRIGNRYLMSDRGLSMEQATQRLIEAGYLGQDAGISDAMNLIRTSLTRPQYTPEGIERIAQAEQEVRFSDYLEAHEEAAQNATEDYDPLAPGGDFGLPPDFEEADLVANNYFAADPGLQVEVHALMAQVEGMGFDPVDVLGDVISEYADATQDEYNTAARQVLAAAIAGSNRNGSRTATESIQPATGTSGAGSAAGPITAATQQGLEQAQPVPLPTPGNFNADVRGTMGTRMDAVAEPGFGPASLKEALAYHRARKQQQTQAQQPTDEPAYAAQITNDGAQAAPTPSTQVAAQQQAQAPQPAQIDAGQTWAAMPTEERQQAVQAAGLNKPQAAKALATDNMEGMPAAIADKLAPVLAAQAPDTQQAEAPTPSIPAFQTYADSIDWAKARAKELGKSFIAYRASDEYKNQVLPIQEPLYATAKANWDKETAENAAQLQAAMRDAGLKHGDTVAWNQPGPFLSSTPMRGELRLAKNGMPFVHLPDEIAVAKPGGKLGYTKTLRWHPHMEKQSEAPVDTTAGIKQPPPQLSDEEQIANAVAYADELGLVDKNDRADAIATELAFAWGMAKDEILDMRDVQAAIRKKPSKEAKEKSTERFVQGVMRQASKANQEMLAKIAAMEDGADGSVAGGSLISTYTAAEAEAQQAQQEQAAKAEAARKRAETAAATEADNRKRIAQASVIAADSFELGQDPMQSLTGQKDVFADAAQEEAAPAPAQPKPTNLQEGIQQAQANAQQKFAPYDAVAAEYGYSVGADGVIALRNGQKSNLKVVPNKKGDRFQVDSIRGNKMFSGGQPEALGKFLEKFWDAKKLPKAEAAPVSAQAGQQAENFAWVEKSTGYEPARPQGRPYVLKTGIGKNLAVATAFGAKPKLSDTNRYFASPEEAQDWGKANGYLVGDNPYTKSSQPAAPTKSLARSLAEKQVGERFELSQDDKEVRLIDSMVSTKEAYITQDGQELHIAEVVANENLKKASTEAIQSAMQGRPASSASVKRLQAELDSRGAVTPKAEDDAPAKRKLPGKLATKAAEVEAQRAAYFAPGNIVGSYPNHDRVISYTPADSKGNWNVTVQAVEKRGDEWVNAPRSTVRTHSTQPEARELKAGPMAIAKVQQQDAPKAVPPASPTEDAGKDAASDAPKFSRTGTADTTAQRQFKETERAYGGREAYDKAKAAGKTKLTYGQWVQVRTPNFKAWFGDWEAVRAEERLDAMEPVQVRVPDAWRGLGHAELRQKMAEELDRMVREKVEINHPELGMIRVGRAGAKKSQSTSRDPAKVLVAADLDNVLPAAFHARSDAPDTKEQGVHGYSTLLARVDVDGSELIASFSVRQQQDGAWYYNTVTLKDVQNKTPVASPRDTPSAGERATSANTGVSKEKAQDSYGSPGALSRPLGETPIAGLSDFIRRPLARVNPENVSKVVDPDTGEPLVVYHGTNADFAEFKKEHQRPGQYGGQGFFFTANPDAAGLFGDAVMPVFLQAKTGIMEKRRAKLRGEELQVDHIRPKEDARDIWVVMDSTQVKSSIGNNGDFDGANPDIRRSFAGQQSASADTHALASAQQRLDAGEDADTVRQDTGWFKGVDGKWRFEISDADAKLAIGYKGVALGKLVNEERYPDAVMPLADLLEHPALFAAYPALADMRVAFIKTNPNSRQKGSFDAANQRITLSDDMAAREALSTLLHEIQHGVQNVEGFATGGNSDQFASGPMFDRRARDLAADLGENLTGSVNAGPAEIAMASKYGDPKEMDAIASKHGFASADEALSFLKSEDEKRTPFGQYRRLAGEVEARNTQTRQKLTDAQRRATPPSQTADVADSDVIVMFNGKEMASVPMPANAAPSATPQPTRTPAATIRTAISKAYGKLLGQLESKGLVTLAQTEAQAIEAAAQARAQKTGGDVAQIKRSLSAAMQGGTGLDVKRSNGAVQGFFDPQTGQSFLIADNLSAEAAPGVLMHEVGIHMAADGSMKALFNRAALMLKAQKADPFMRAVQAKLDAAGETSAEEVAAYLVEAYENDRAKAPASVKRWLQDLLAAVKAWLHKKGIVGADSLTVADIAAVARANAKSMARGDVGGGVKFSRTGGTDQTMTEAFKRWFSKSKVVDADGKPLVMYHGTNANEGGGAFTQFDTYASNYGLMGMGGYFTADPEVASSYTKKGRGDTPTVYPVYLSIQNPLDMDAEASPDMWRDQFPGVEEFLEGGTKNENWYRAAEDLMADQELSTWEGAEAMQEGLRSMGFDGITHIGGGRVNSNDARHRVYITFDPQQTKSATGNNGDFDPKNPDIRFSRAPQWQAPADRAEPAPATWQSPETGRWDEAAYNIQDRHIDTKRVQQAIEASNGQLADDLNVRQREELFHGRSAKEMQDFKTQELNPMLEQLGKDGIELAAFEEYLHARHAPEANKVMAERNPNQAMINAGRAKAAQEVTALERKMATASKDEQRILKKALNNAIEDLNRWNKVVPYSGSEESRLMLSGMSDQQAKAIMGRLSPQQHTAMQRSAAMFDAIVAKNRGLMVEYELESQDTIDSWASLFENYVPLMREEPEGSLHHGMGTGEGFSVKGREVKSRTGSTRKVVDIVANLAMQREKTIVRGEKNRVTMTLMHLAEANPNPDFWKIGAPDKVQKYDPSTRTVKWVTDPLYKSRENVIVSKRLNDKGQIEEVALTFEKNDPRAMRMAVALKNLDDASLNKVLQTLAPYTRALAALSTQYNPVWGAFNFLRDTFGVMISLGNTPLTGQNQQGESTRLRIYKDAWAALPSLYRGARAERKGQEDASEWGKLWADFQKTGGATGFRDMLRTGNERSDLLKSVVDPDAWMETSWGKALTLGGTIKPLVGAAERGRKALSGWISDFNLALENATRVAVYKAGLEKGLSKERAASIAKNITVNFNRRGAVGHQIGAAYAFFNASVQGTARMAEAMTEMQKPGDPRSIRLTQYGKHILQGSLAIGAMQALMLAAAGFGDDEPPEFVRDRNIVIPTGWTGAGPEKGYITIPLPLGYNIIPAFGRRLTEFAMNGGKDPFKHITGIMALVFDGFNPIGSGSFSQMLAPTVLDPIIAARENRDSFGRPIARESLDPNVPGHALSRSTATAISRWLSEGLNSISGGDAYTRGAISPSPDQLDYAAAQYAGGVGREIMKTIQSISGLANGEDVPMYKIPLLGRLAGSADSPSAQMSAYYRNINEIDKANKRIKGLREDGLMAEAVAERQKLGPLLLAQASATEKQVKRLRKTKAELLEKGASREEVRRVEENMSATMQRFNASVERQNRLAPA